MSGLLLVWGVGGCSDSADTTTPGTAIDGGGGGVSGDGTVWGQNDKGGSEDTGEPDEGQPDEGPPDIHGDTGPLPGEFGYPCDEDSDCYSEWCVDSAQGQVCSKTCDSDCPPGWSCSQVVTAGGDQSFICVPNDTFLCRPCQSDDDCNVPGFPESGVCVDRYPGVSLCSRHCDASSTCPTGFECGPLQPYGEDGPTLDLCVADTEEACQCTQKFVDSNAVSLCAVSNDFGTCEGEIRCLEAGPMPACDAQEPAQEVCNGVDDDCDGETDEEASDCTFYFHDIDGDGYGQGNGECLCEKPNNNWIEVGGDCNEQVTAVNPGAQEICNLADDNCDGVIDEENALGCTTHYLDGDSDGFGIDGVSACLCAGAQGYAPFGGECNDQDPNVNPGADETCNGIDDDCDQATDEADSVGCSPYFLDQDGDGYGLTDKVKCLCGPTGAYLANKPNDCNDVIPEINPDAPEICNGADDNCNNETDEGDPTAMCPSVAHGTASCQGGTCALISCEEGWSDTDGDPLNGCECAASSLELPGGVGQTCMAPVQLGNLLDSGSEAEVVDNIVPNDDVDWYAFTAIDGADSGCDTFSLRVFFVHNPQEQFAFDVFKGGCQSSAEVCKQVTEYTHTTNFFDGSGAEPTGECPCAASTSPGVQECTDQTEAFYVKVYRKPEAAATCAAYTLKVTNGL